MRSYDKVVDTFPIDVQDQVYADCMRILLGKVPQHTDESVLKNMIDAMSHAVMYEPRASRDDYIYELAVGGKRAAEIAAVLECDPSTVYRSAGWKNAQAVKKNGHRN